jgi:hypothetical protein
MESSNIPAEMHVRVTAANHWANFCIVSDPVGQGFAITMALFIGATAVVSLRTIMLFPKRLGWASVLIAFGLLITPIAYAVLALVLVWLLVVSIWLYRQNGSTA